MKYLFEWFVHLMIQLAEQKMKLRKHNIIKLTNTFDDIKQ